MITRTLMQFAVMGIIFFLPPASWAQTIIEPVSVETITSFVDKTSPSPDKIEIVIGSASKEFDLKENKAANIQNVFNWISISKDQSWKIILKGGGNEIGTGLPKTAANKPPEVTNDPQSTKIDITTNYSGPSAPSGLCVAEASKWASEIVKYEERAWLLVFNEYGSPCFRDSIGSQRIPRRITQGDPIYVGVLGVRGQVEKLHPDFSSCDLQPTIPLFQNSDLNINNIILQSIKTPTFAFKRFPPRECFNSALTIEARTPQGTAIARDEIKQYARYRGTFHVGALWTDLEESNFSTVDLGEGSVIRSDRTDDKGPLYVGSVVIYGFPHYVSSALGRRTYYAGRDIINENRFSDRLGLVLSLGIEEPQDTFGIGLAYELASGINITASWLNVRRSVLSGVNIGDAFTGTNEQIPTTKDWDRQIVFGLSIDSRYIVKFLGGAAQQ